MKTIKLKCGNEHEIVETGAAHLVYVGIDFLDCSPPAEKIKLLGQSLIELAEMGYQGFSLDHDHGYYGAIENRRIVLSKNKSAGA